jgi:hypothetical protein
MVAIMIKRGTNLYDASGFLGGTQDPYVAVVPSWLPKQQAHTTGTVTDGGKNCVWKKKDAPFCHFPVAEIPDLNPDDVHKYTLRLEVVDDNLTSDVLIGAASLVRGGRRGGRRRSGTLHHR